MLEDDFPQISHVSIYLGITSQFVSKCLFKNDYVSKSLWKDRDSYLLWSRLN